MHNSRYEAACRRLTLTGTILWANDYRLQAASYKKFGIPNVVTLVIKVIYIKSYGRRARPISWPIQSISVVKPVLGQDFRFYQQQANSLLAIVTTVLNSLAGSLYQPTLIGIKIPIPLRGFLSIMVWRLPILQSQGEMMKNNKSRLITPWLTAISCLLLSACIDLGTDDDDSALVRNTQYGQVEGKLENGSLQFLGLPYAAAPVDELRWKAPVDHADWQDTKSVQQYGEKCSQIGSQFGSLDSHDFTDIPSIIGSEDCLTLNIFRPDTNEANLPVLFFTHGGSNRRGFSGDATYDGANIARDGNIVVVTYNYRLGPLGWLAHPGLRNGTDEDNSGNFGNLDGLKALDFVRDNIDQFGGDPQQITLGGQSAGASNTFSLLHMPAAKDKFVRAFAISSSIALQTLADGEAQSEGMILNLMVNAGQAVDVTAAATVYDTMSDAEVETFLRGLTAAQILAADPARVQKAFSDGTVILDTTTAIGTGQFNHVPMLLTNSQDEFTLFMSPLYKFPQNKTSSAFDLYFNSDPNEPTLEYGDFVTAFPASLFDAVNDLGSDYFEVLVTDATADQLTTFFPGNDVYVSHFAWDESPGPFSTLFGATHAGDLPFLFNNFDDHLFSFMYSDANEAGRIALAEAYSTAHINFVKTGNPGADIASITWSPWVAGSEERMIFDATDDELELGYADGTRVTKEELDGGLAQLNAISPLAAGFIQQVLSLL